MIEGLHGEGPMAGIFARWHTPRPGIFAGRPAFFMDRDGVIVEEKNYLHSPEDISLIPGIGAALLKLNRAGIPVIIVTNQAGIGRGYYGWDQFVAVQDHIYQRLGREGAHVDACVACPFHPEAREPYISADHYFRKPNPGMILWPAEACALDLKRSWIAGDNLSDLQAGERAGLGGLAHVLTGHGMSIRSAVIEWAGDSPLFRQFPDACSTVEAFLKGLSIPAD